MSYVDKLTKQLSTEDMISKITSFQNFSFSRYGDGEFAALMGKNGRNTDQHIYFPDMGKRLYNILQSVPSYYIGLQTLAYKLHADFVDKITKENDLNWCKSDVLHHSSIDGELQPFLDALKHREVLLVAPKRLRQFKNYDYFIEIPDLNCYLEISNIREKIRHELKDHLVVLYCGSMMTNILVDDFKDENITQIDCGSVFEPYIGHANRSYHANKINELNEH